MPSFSGTTPTDAVELQKLLALDGAASDVFGISVALSSDGDTALVGARFEDTTPSTNNGAAYIFTRSGGTWTQQQKLLASDYASNDNFSWSVDLSSDGNTALIGAYTKNGSMGAAYVFTRSGTTWTEQQILLASDATTGDSFGYSVALSDDGNTALIGAYTEDTTPNTNNGAAYVFTSTAGTWTQQQKLVASDPATDDNFGWSVALSADGNTAIIGAYGEDTTPNTDQGAAYVFIRSGVTWTQQQKLIASDVASSDRFGHRVALSADGNTALISAYFEDTSPNTTNGAAYVFTRSGSTWTQQQKLLASDAATDDWFGSSVSLSADGNTALIGADNEDTTPNTTNGAAYLFTRSGSTWTQQQKILASDARISDFFGASVALSSDGSTALIGATGEDTTYVYALGRTLDNKLYSYNSTLGGWDVSAFGELLAPATRVFTSSDTFVVPTGAKVVEVTCIGAGGGGGGGGRNVTGDGGGSGGGGGGLSKYLFRVEDIGGVDASITVTVGTGGAGGAATASGTTALSGNAGVAGGATSFGSYLQALGGANGLGGTTSARVGGAGGYGMFTGVNGGDTSFNADSGAPTPSGAGGGGGGGAFFGTGGHPFVFNLTQSGTSGDAGTSNATLLSPGSGGNGRDSTTTTVLAAGAGGLYGGGGGGGGEGSTAGATGAGGAGGAGANGACFVRVWYG